MRGDLGIEERELLLESLSFSKVPVRDAEGTPDGVKEENLRQIEAVEKKVRKARRRE